MLHIGSFNQDSKLNIKSFCMYINTCLTLRDNLANTIKMNMDIKTQVILCSRISLFPIHHFLLCIIECTHNDSNIPFLESNTIATLISLFSYKWPLDTEYVLIVSWRVFECDLRTDPIKWIAPDNSTSEQSETSACCQLQSTRFDKFCITQSQTFSHFPLPPHQPTIPFPLSFQWFGHDAKLTTFYKNLLLLEILGF